MVQSMSLCKVEIKNAEGNKLFPVCIREAMGKILARGHSRVPVYSGNPKNVIGLLLVKSLLTVRPETETPVSALSIRRIPRYGY